MQNILRAAATDQGRVTKAFVCWQLLINFIPFLLCTKLLSCRWCIFGFFQQLKIDLKVIHYCNTSKIPSNHHFLLSAVSFPKLSDYHVCTWSYRFQEVAPHQLTLLTTIDLFDTPENIILKRRIGIWMCIASNKWIKIVPRRKMSKYNVLISQKDFRIRIVTMENITLFYGIYNFAHVAGQIYSYTVTVNR